MVWGKSSTSFCMTSFLGSKSSLVPISRSTSWLNIPKFRCWQTSRFTISYISIPIICRFQVKGFTSITTMASRAPPSTFTRSCTPNILLAPTCNSSTSSIDSKIRKSSNTKCSTASCHDGLILQHMKSCASTRTHAKLAVQGLHLLLLQSWEWLLSILQHGRASGHKGLWCHLLSLLVLHVMCSWLHNAAGRELQGFTDKKKSKSNCNKLNTSLKPAHSHTIHSQQHFYLGMHGRWRGLRISNCSQVHQVPL